LKLSERAAAAFQDVDPRMLSATMFIAAAVLFAKRRFTEAAAMMDELLASGHLDAERDLRAMALHNAGAMHLRAGHDEAAMANCRKRRPCLNNRDRPDCGRGRPRAI
jgi:hypothetical protein